MRNDIHSPSQIIPADYEYVGQEHVKIEQVGDCQIAIAERAKIEAHKARTGGTYSRHEHGGVCHICGSVNAIWTVLFYHKPSNTYIRTGQDCAYKLDASAEGEFNRFKAGLNNALEAQAGKKKAKAILEQAGLEKAWDIFENEDKYRIAYIGHDSETGEAYEATRLQKEETIIQDLVGKLVTYGSISDKQIAFLKSLLGQLDTRAQKQIDDAAKKAAAADCPNGRVEITGTIVSFKVQDTQFGIVTKMLVVADSGFKVWGSRPAGDFEKGYRVSFTATVTPSKDDAKFGFFKRPTRGKIIADETEAAYKPYSESEVQNGKV